MPDTTVAPTVDLGRLAIDLADGLDALEHLIDNHEEDALTPTLRLILNQVQSCKDRLDGHTTEAPEASATTTAIAARIHAALEARERAESCVITSTLAIEQLSSDYTRNIAQTLDNMATPEIWKIYQHLHAAMQLIPEGDRPDTFKLDESHEAPALED